MELEWFAVGFNWIFWKGMRSNDRCCECNIRKLRRCEKTIILNIKMEHFGNAAETLS